MIGMVTASELPHPIYLLVPFCATFAGFLSAMSAFLNQLRPDWGRAWVTGNVVGAGFGVFLVVALYALDVDSAQ